MLLMTERERELTLAEVAASLRVSENTARALLKRHAIPARKQGRQYRINESDVEAYKQALRDQYRNKP
jgi:putative molybdopterin biosynthesis protein